MTLRSRSLVVAVLAAVFVLGAASCGDDDEEDASGTAATTESSVTTTSAVEEGQHLVDVFLIEGDGGPDCDEVVSVERHVSGDDVLALAMTELLAGPTTDEESRGLGGWFSSETAGSLNGVRVSEGVADIDFADFSQTIPNASSSCGSAGLLAQLDATATQFPSVERAVYSFDGDTEAFYAWLQRDVPG